MAHTKLPWRWDSDMVLAEHDGHTDHVADCSHRRDSDRFANAAFIVQAVNNFDVMREALRSIERNTCCEQCNEAALVARNALAKVTP